MCRDATGLIFATMAVVLFGIFCNAGAAAPAAKPPEPGRRFIYSIASHTTISDNRGYSAHQSSSTTSIVSVGRRDLATGGDFQLSLIAATIDVREGVQGRSVQSPAASFEMKVDAWKRVRRMKGLPTINLERIAGSILGELEAFDKLAAGAALQRTTVVTTTEGPDLVLLATYNVAREFSIGNIRCIEVAAAIDAASVAPKGIFQKIKVRVEGRFTAAHETGEVVRAALNTSVHITGRDEYSMTVVRDSEMHSTSLVFRKWLLTASSSPLRGGSCLPGAAGCVLAMAALVWAAGRITSVRARLSPRVAAVCCMLALVAGLPRQAIAAPDAPPSPFLVAALESAFAAEIMSVGGVASVPQPASTALTAGASTMCLKSMTDLAACAVPPAYPAVAPVAGPAAAASGASTWWLLGGAAAAGGTAAAFGSSGGGTDAPDTVDPDSPPPDEDGGTDGGTGGLSDVVVNQRSIALTVFDHARIDGDQIDLIVNNQPLLANHVLPGPPGTTVNVLLNTGPNTVVVHADNEGAGPPNTGTLLISNVIAGAAEQRWRLHTGDTATLTITAP